MGVGNSSRRHDISHNASERFEGFHNLNDTVKINEDDTTTAIPRIETLDDSENTSVMAIAASNTEKEFSMRVAAASINAEYNLEETRREYLEEDEASASVSELPANTEVHGWDSSSVSSDGSSYIEPITCNYSSNALTDGILMSEVMEGNTSVALAWNRKIRAPLAKEADENVFCFNDSDNGICGSRRPKPTSPPPEELEKGHEEEDEEEEGESHSESSKSVQKVEEPEPPRVSRPCTSKPLKAVSKVKKSRKNINGDVESVSLNTQEIRAQEEEDRDIRDPKMPRVMPPYSYQRKPLAADTKTFHCSPIMYRQTVRGKLEAGDTIRKSVLKSSRNKPMAQDMWSLSSSDDEYREMNLHNGNRSPTSIKGDECDPKRPGPMYYTREVDPGPATRGPSILF